MNRITVFKWMMAACSLFCVAILAGQGAALAVAVEFAASAKVSEEEAEELESETGTLPLKPEALAETIAHLDLLRAEDRLAKEFAPGRMLYRRP